MPCSAKIPFLSRGGVAATSRKISRSILYGADGVVLVNAPRNQTLGQHHCYGFALSRSRFAPVCAG